MGLKIDISGDGRSDGDFSYRLSSPNVLDQELIDPFSSHSSDPYIMNHGSLFLQRHMASMTAFVHVQD
jgi:hypothetical protein